MDRVVNELLAELAAYWRSQGVEPAGGASLVEIEAFEWARGVRLPPDVRAYFATLNGTRDDAMDQELISFWSLDRVRSAAAELEHQEPVSPEASEFFCFADYSIWCHAYAVRLSADGTAPTEVAVVNDGRDLIPVASSFSAFLRAYLSDARRVALHPPPASK
jgi:hypothetical protein